MKTFKIFWILLFALFCISCGIKNKDAPETIKPLNAPFEMSALERPLFPERTFNITAYGAIDDGQTMNHEAFAKAIHACHDAGGGTVIVPPGTWLTGPIELLSNVNLHLDESAEIRFTTNKYYYYPDSVSRAQWDLTNPLPLVYANGCINIAVTGLGKLDGQGIGWWPFHKKWWSRFREHFGEEVNVRAWEGLLPTSNPTRPSMIQPMNCKNVLLEGITVVDGSFWMVHPVMCENVIIRRLTVTASSKAPDPDTPNTDGINPESCRNVLIEHCTINTGDDSFAIKSGKDEEGRHRGRPSENIVIRHSNIKRIAIGSEMSGGVRNIYVHDLKTEGSFSSMIHVKTRRGRGGIVENLWFENIESSGAGPNTILINMEYWTHVDPAPYEPVSERTPQFRNFHFKNINCGTGIVGIVIHGLPEMPVENIEFNNIQIDEVMQGIEVSNAMGVTFDHITVSIDETSADNVSLEGTTPYNKPIDTFGQNIAVVLENSRNIYLKDFRFAENEKPIVIVTGKYSGEIKMDKTLSRATFSYDEGAEKGALIVPKM